MKIRTTIIALLATAGVAFTAGSLVAQHEGHDEMNMDEMMEMYMKLAQPGPHHKKLDNHIGEWAQTITHYGMGEGPEITKGTISSKWILDGRYILDHVVSEFRGVPFEGFGLTGYDNTTKEYFSTWIDTMGTGIMLTRGQMDDSGNIVQTGSVPTPDGPLPVRTVVSPVNNDKSSYTMYMDMGAGEMKVMEIENIRVSH